MNAFGTMLREWRGIRRFSQLQLAMEADMSARHLSFLESGRANPSKGMVLRLSHALEMPRAAINQALYHAGFAPVFPETAGDSAMLAPVHRAMEMTLKSHEPLPGVAADRHWNIVSANGAAAKLLSFAPPAESANLIEMVIAAASSDWIENWEEVAILSLIRLRSEIIDLGGDEKLSALAGRLGAVDRLCARNIADVRLDQAIIPSVLRIGDIRLSLFSTIAQFGSVQEIRAADLRIELMFPLDEATHRWFAGGV